MATGKAALLRDRLILDRLDRLKATIEGWAVERDLWADVGFKAPFEYRNEAPAGNEALLMHFDGPFFQMFNTPHEYWEGLQEDFQNILEAEGFYYELNATYNLSLYPKNEDAGDDFLMLYRWQWIQHLAERRLFDLHAEVFEHFAKQPEALQNLHWRKYEEFLDAVFRNQGFRTELGPGGNDGGVDIRLYQSESIPEIVTVVQAKRHAAPIGRNDVAALAAVAQMEYAPEALFVTTSRYQPAARNFALNTESRVDFPTVKLADMTHTREWCESIGKRLADYFQSGEQEVPPILTSRPKTELTGKVVVASKYGRNSFAVIETDYPYEVILRSIGDYEASGDTQVGTQMPDQTLPPPSWEPLRILAFKGESKAGREPTFWGNQMLFRIWDGTPQFFDICD